MSNGIIGYSQIGDAAQASPSIFGDCPNTLLQDKGLGYFIHQDFLGDYATPAATTTAPGLETITGTGTSVFGNATSATFGPNVLSMATGGTDNNNTGLVGEEFGQIVRNSGNKFWFETRFALNTLGDAAFFIGLSTRAGANTATTGIIAADPSNSAVAGLTAVTLIGFVSQQVASAIAKANAVYAKGSGTPVTVLADVTNATAITAAGGLVANIVAQTFVKFGIRFDGYKHLYFYVNGYKVAGVEVDATFDQTSYYVPVVAVKTGTGSAVTSEVDFVRAAFQARS